MTVTQADSRSTKQRGIAVAGAGYVLAIAVLLSLHLSGLEVISSRHWLLIVGATFLSQSLLWVLVHRGWDAHLRWDPHFVIVPMTVGAALLNLYMYVSPASSSLLLMTWFIVLLFAVGLIGAVGVVATSAAMGIGRIVVNVVLLQRGKLVTAEAEAIFILAFFIVSIYVGIVFERLRRERDERKSLLRERAQAVERLQTSENRYRTLFEEVPVGIYRTTPAGRNLACNPALMQMLGYPDLATLQASDVASFYEDREDRRRWQQLMDRDGVVHGYEARARRRDGTVFWVRDSARAVYGPDGRVLYYQGTWEDITERRLAEEAAREASATLAARLTQLEQRTQEITLLNRMMQLLQGCATVNEAYAVAHEYLQQLFPTAAGALAIINPSHNVVERVTGSDERCGEAVFAPADCWALRQNRAHLVTASQPTLRCSHLSDGRTDSLCIALTAQGEAAGVLTLVKGFGDPDGDPPEAISEPTLLLATAAADHIGLALANLRLRETLRLQSIRDPLTGLFNRRYLEETLERELRRVTRMGAPLGVIMLDLDHFKQFNDVFGHEAGDTLLRKLGQFLQDHIRVEDIACRYGGEEFTLILPEAPLEVVRKRAEQLRQHARGLQVQHRGQPLGPVTVSCGVAVYPEHGDTGDALLRAADTALYRAKAAGRDRTVLAHGVPTKTKRVQTAKRKSMTSPS
jgi:diguanylate cyclase (GGDEF)-like protein/PAS domain S-box-containing protein